MSNQYSQTWFDLFLKRENDSQTRREVQFILSQIRVGLDTKVLDIACGNGRHLRKLAAHGFEVYGIDVDEKMLQEAEETVPEGFFYLLDMMDLEKFTENDFDLIIIMWQSFGYFDDEDNKKVLQEIKKLMKPGAILILDIYNKDFFVNHQGVRKINRGKFTIEETKFVKDNRLEVHLDYGGNMGSDTFNWRIYSEGEFIELIEKIGFNHLKSCTNFNLETVPASESPRIQYVLQNPIM